MYNESVQDKIQEISDFWLRRKMRSGGRSAKPGKDEPALPVFLNVYDFTPMNGIPRWLGLGLYHSGVQVSEVEFAFHGHKLPMSGVSAGVPKQCPGYAFRKQILIGFTPKDYLEVRTLIVELGEEYYRGNLYNLISRNCNHFCNDVCVRLTGNPIPSWINRPARIGALCSCITPASVNSIQVRIKDNKVNNEGEIRKNQRSRSGDGMSASSSSSSLSSVKSSLPSHPVARSRSHGTKSSPNPSSPKIFNSRYSHPPHQHL